MSLYADIRQRLIDAVIEREKAVSTEATPAALTELVFMRAALESYCAVGAGEIIGL